MSVTNLSEDGVKNILLTHLKTLARVYNHQLFRQNAHPKPKSESSRTIQYPNPSSNYPQY